MRALVLAGLLMAGQDGGVIWVEGEAPAAQKGSGGADHKFAACGLQVLGWGWGARDDHYAEYRFAVAADLDARLHLRYARATEGPARLDVLVDGERIDTLELPATGGWGAEQRTWKLASLKLGRLKAGEHTVRFKSVANQNNVNLDGFAIAPEGTTFAVDEAFWKDKLPPDLKKISHRKPERRELKLGEPVAAEHADAPRELVKGLEFTARKPQPYLVKAYDAGEPTDFDRDVVWHLLQKEKDPRFTIPQAGKVGVIDFISDIAVTVDVQAAQADAHLLDAYVAHGPEAEVLIQPIASDTILFVVRGAGRVTFASSKEDCDLLPRQRYGYGATTTTGRLRWAGFDASSGVTCYDDWNPNGGQLTGSMLCAIAGSMKPSAHELSLEGMTGASLTFEPGGKTLVLAATLRRFGSRERVQQNGMKMYAVESEEEAVQAAVRRSGQALSADWPAQLRASAKRCGEFPRVTLPKKSWEIDFFSCLELPLANTFSPCRQMKRPFYNFCRAHAHEPYGWWSYGMHAHESLSTFITNLFRPDLSQEWLSGHLDLQFESGEYPYGVNPKGRRKQEAWGAATAPFIPWEAWTTYAWSGDREFLARAFESGVRNHGWWMSKERTRTDVPLQRWLNFMETVRDDPDLTTWTATGGAENQEALDLNCYMLVQERTLQRMAEELGRDGKPFAEMAEKRLAAIRKHMWGGDAYYGVDLLSGKLVKVKDISTFFPLWAGFASKEEAEKIVGHLRDPKKFASRFPVPTLAMDEPHYGPQWHWHGSNWVETSLLVMQGLRDYGYAADAARLAEVNCRMVFATLEETGHFREYYNTETGKPTDLTDYIWTALPAAMIVEIIFGVRARADGLEIKPSLPEGWDDIRLENLRARGKRVSVTVKRGAKPGAFVPWSELKDGAVLEVGPVE